MPDRVNHRCQIPVSVILVLRLTRLVFHRSPVSVLCCRITIYSHRFVIASCHICTLLLSLYPYISLYIPIYIANHLTSRKYLQPSSHSLSFICKPKKFLGPCLYQTQTSQNIRANKGRENMDAPKLRWSAHFHSKYLPYLPLKSPSFCSIILGRTCVPPEYHNFLAVFSKQLSHTESEAMENYINEIIIKNKYPLSLIDSAKQLTLALLY